jgi:hypothetical protein
MNKQAAVKALTATGFGYGIAAIAAPAALQRLYGTAESTPELRVTTRMWGTAVLTIAATATRAKGKDLDALLLLVGVGNLIDAAGSAFAIREGFPAKAAALGVTSSAGVAAAAFYTRSLD